MIRKKVILSIIIIGLITTYGLYVFAAENENSEISITSVVEENYTTILKRWNDIPLVRDKELVLLPANHEENQKYVVSKKNSYGYHADTVRWKKGTEIILDVEVNKTGLYNISFDYYVLDDSILPPEGSIKINDKYQYYEARRIIFNNLWESNNDDIKRDRYGNEVIPRPIKIHKWLNTYAYDASYLHMKPLYCKLNKGKNRIKLINSRGDLLLGQVSFKLAPEPKSYKDYLNYLPEKNQVEEMIIIEGEDANLKNHSSIRAANEQDPALTPYNTRYKLLNILSGRSWSKGGQSVTWKFTVPESGMYKIGFKYKQDILHGMPVFRRIKIDGKVPIRTLNNYPFYYGRSWQNEVLGNKEKEYSFYLEKGEHNLTMTVNLSSVRPLVEEITRIMNEINNMTLKIKKLTGNKVDKYRDWSLTEYIPGLKDQLLDWAETLEEENRKISKLNPYEEEIEELVNLDIASRQLRELAKEPNQLPNRLNQLSQGSSSVSLLLGSLLEILNFSPLSLDKIYIYNNTDLPQPEADIETRIKESFNKFMLSFEPQQYKMSNKKGELDVWVNNSRQFVQLMQKMIDEEFTPRTGVKVNLSLMPDESKIILANASGEAPDVALGVSNWIPYRLAIRDAVLNLKQFNDFEEVISRFAKGQLIPFAFEEGIYALPETQDFWVLFYREDILNALNIPVPDTWSEVLEILPELQRLGMNFASPLSYFGGFKPFVTTTPFIYQFGGELYKPDGTKTAIDSEEALEGIKFMTDLFTIYNVPQEIPNVYHHFRYGRIPVAISNFTTYVQLTVAAPEIANAWEIAPYPGLKRGGKIVRWAPGGGKTSIIFDDTKYPEEAWEFLKWWTSAEVQSEFAFLVQTAFGEEYMWNTANLKAFSQLPWPDEDKKVILEQLKWVRQAPWVPGGYMAEREISNAWNKIVFDGENPRTTIDEAVITINREIARKMEEFGYMEDGKIIRPYRVPTINNIDEWIEKDD